MGKINKNSTHSEIRQFVFKEKCPAVSGENVQEKQKIAEDILTCAVDWLQLPSTDLNDGNGSRQKRRECKKYIKENYLPKTEAYSFVFGGLILSVILNMVISWIIKRLFAGLFGD